MRASRPRVLIVIAQLDIGGAERQVVHLATGLAAEGFDAEVAVFYPEGDLEGFLRDSGVNVHHLRRSSAHGVETILDLRRLLRRRPMEIVHSFLWPANWRARAAAILADVPVVIASPRSVETWIRWYHVLIDRVLARKTTAMLVNASAIRDFLVQREGIPRDLFHVVPNGIDLASFQNLPSRTAARATLGIVSTGPVVLTVGNLQPEKNHEDFLALAAHLLPHQPEACFIVVGDGPRRGSLLERAVELGVADRIRWEGRREDVGTYLAACDVFVNTSQREGCSNAILEAMAAGRPVVAYGVGGNPELIADGGSGRVVPFGRTDELSHAVGAYLQDPRLARTHGEEGARRALSEFSRAAMVRRTAALYRQFLTRRMTVER